MDNDFYESEIDDSRKNILELPELFLIAVLKKFDLKNRLKLARVCKKWNILVKDSMLWTKIDLCQYKNELNLVDLKQLISVYGCDSTKLISLCGNFSHDNVLSNKYHTSNDETKQINYLDINFLDILTPKCTFLNTIIFEHLDLSKLQLRNFFKFEHLETFSLKWCYLDQNWFKQSENKDDVDHVTKIKHLYFMRSCSDLIVKEDMENICKKMPNLKTLCIIQTKSTLTDDIVDLISKNCKNLEYLELVNTLLSDNAILSICNSPSLSRNLRHLNLSMSSSLSNLCLVFIGEHLQNLKSLNLTSCFGISNISLLQNLINLNYLNINNTSLDKTKIRELLLPVLSKCESNLAMRKC